MLSILFLIINTNLWAGTISCNGLLCISDNSISSLSYNSFNNQLWITNILNNSLNASIVNSNTSSELKTYIQTSINDVNNNFSIIPTPKLDLYFDFSSNSPETNSGKAVVISSMINNLSLISDGKNGVDGYSSSLLCANAFKSGALGLSLKNYWNSYHSSSVLNCTKSDIEYVYNHFSCPVGYAPGNSTVAVIRYIQVRDCYNGSAQSHTYINKKLQCNLSLIDLGLVKNPGRSIETAICPFGGPCDFTLENNEYTDTLAILTPTSGTKAILAGDMTAFVYSYENLLTSNFQGIIGYGGNADLPDISLLIASYPYPGIRYCVKTYDLINNNGDINYETFPFVSYLKIYWKPFIENPSAKDGFPGTQKNGISTVIKGLDSSVRYWLGKDNIIN
jgi:hypothetical protein